MLRDRRGQVQGGKYEMLTMLLIILGITIWMLVTQVLPAL